MALNHSGRYCNTKLCLINVNQMCSRRTVIPLALHCKCLITGFTVRITMIESIPASKLGFSKVLFSEVFKRPSTSYPPCGLTRRTRMYFSSIMRALTLHKHAFITLFTVPFTVPLCFYHIVHMYPPHASIYDPFLFL